MGKGVSKTNGVVKDENTNIDILIFGGNGFIGSAIANEATAQGLQVVCLSRNKSVYAHTGRPELLKFKKGDALDVSTYNDILSKSKSVIISIGTPPVPNFDTQNQIKMNCDTVITPLKAAASCENVRSAVVIGATMPHWLSWVSPGYYTGKNQVEDFARTWRVDSSLSSDDNITLLKPGAVYGTRKQVIAGYALPIPLSIFLQPLAYMLSSDVGLTVCDTLKKGVPSVFDGLLEVPVDVKQLAKVAVDEAINPSKKHFHILTPTEIVNRQRCLEKEEEKKECLID